MTNPLPPLLIIEAHEDEAYRVAGLLDRFNVYHMYNTNPEEMSFGELSENIRLALVKSTESRSPVAIYRHMLTRRYIWDNGIGAYGGLFARILQRHGIHRINLLNVNEKHPSPLNESTVHDLFEHATKLRAATPRWAGDMGIQCFVGSNRPQLIIVGDTFNAQKDSTYSWPFHRNSGSGPFLEKALQLIGLSSTHPNLTDMPPVAIVNINDQFSDIAMSQLTAGLDLPIVALGDLASEALTSLGYDHQKVMHPSHVKRFNRMSIDDYAKSIGNARGEAEIGCGVRAKRVLPNIVRQNDVIAGTSELVESDEHVPFMSSSGIIEGLRPFDGLQEKLYRGIYTSSPANPAYGKSAIRGIIDEATPLVELDEAFKKIADGHAVTFNGSVLDDDWKATFMASVGNVGVAIQEAAKGIQTAVAALPPEALEVLQQQQRITQERLRRAANKKRKSK